VRVSDRWIPILAAAIGVLGGMGGALIGGYVANQGQEQQFNAEREAARQDVRREIYATYLQAADSLLAKWDLRQNAGALDTEAQQNKFLEAEAIPLLRAEAAVDLVAEHEVQNAAKAIVDAFDRGISEESEWVALRKNFVEVAHREISPDE
jgi:hypothetical protein